MSIEKEVVSIRLIDGDGHIKAFADVAYGGEIVVRGWSVVNGKKGLFVVPPRKAGKGGLWYDVVKFMEGSTGAEEASAKILSEYELAVEARCADAQDRRLGLVGGD